MGLETTVQYEPKRRIILRDEEKNDISYNDRATRIVKMLRDVEQINAYLAKQTVCVGGQVLKEGGALRVLVRNKKNPLRMNLHCVAWALRIATRRIFHHSSFYKGGRFYTIPILSPTGPAKLAKRR